MKKKVVLALLFIFTVTTPITGHCAEDTDEYTKIREEIEIIKGELSELEERLNILESNNSTASPSEQQTESDTSVRSSAETSDKYRITPNIEGLKITIYQTTDDLICEVINESGQRLSKINISAVYYNNDEKMMTMSEDTLYYIMPQQTTYYVLDLPADYDLQSYVDFNYADITVSASPDMNNTFEFSTDSVQVEDSIGNQGVMAKFTNVSDKTITEIDSIILYYKEGKLIGYDTGFFYDNMAPGANYVEEFHGPHKEKCISESFSIVNPLDFDDYKIVIQTIDQQ